MARSTGGLDKTDLPAFLNHMKTAVAYTTAQTTGTVMRSMPNGKTRKPPTIRTRAKAQRPTIYASLYLDPTYLAAHPYP